MRKSLLFFAGLIFTLYASAQTQVKILEAKRTTNKVTVDGKLDEIAWNDAAKADDFTEFRPVVGRKEEFGNHTETFLMYDNTGIYFGGTCYEKDINIISKELAGRDGFGANDYIGIIIDTYNDKLNGFEYFVTPLGEQWDAKMSTLQNSDNGGEDFAWNAVWKSAVVIHEKGWTFEVFLPYSAIRFGKAQIQDWGINITRRKRKTEQQNTWNAIDPNKNGFLTQEGIWKGISNIKPPIRLQLYPYLSVYGNHYPLNENNRSNWTSQISGGMDLKMGLSQAFTLDATLIPDFGQVQSDNKVLNLTPFEVKFNENRQFFTEGTELFSKGNLFYSRRIGGSPIHANDVYGDLGDKERVLTNPTESKLINASKISGRTQSGLGIGILNAITKAQYATIQNDETNDVRKYETDPLTNYNILVLDQNLKNNSSVTFINTSVLRGSQEYNANVSAALFSINDKKNTYNFSGNASLSHLNFKSQPKDNSMGYSHSFSFSKTSGNLTYSIAEELSDTKYTSNDLGYFTNNNFINHNGYIGYRFIKPKGWYNRISFNLNGNISYLFSPIKDIPTKFQQSQVRLNFNAQTKKLIWFGFSTDYNLAQNDFYEPRSYGKVFKRGSSVGIGSWIETNYAKKYSISAEFFERMFLDFYGLNGYDCTISQNYRFNSKFSLQYSAGFRPRPKSMGYTTTLDDGSTIFALRNVKTVDNIINLKYNFTNKMGLTFRARHYMSKVKNNEFYLLKTDGSLAAANNVTKNLDKNVNYFNIDMVYTWQFAPGSFLNAVWKNATFNSSDNAQMMYFENLGNTLQSNQNNNLSLKVIYFLDYLQLKKQS